MVKMLTKCFHIYYFAKNQEHWKLKSESMSCFIGAGDDQIVEMYAF